MIAGSLVTDWPNRGLEALVHTWQDTASEPLPLCIQQDPPQPTPPKQPIYTPTSWIKCRSARPWVGPVDVHTFSSYDGWWGTSRSKVTPGWRMELGDRWLLLHGDGVHSCSDQVRHTRAHTQRVQIDKGSVSATSEGSCDPQVTKNARSRPESPGEKTNAWTSAFPLDGSWAAVANDKQLKLSSHTSFSNNLEIIDDALIASGY